MSKIRRTLDVCLVGLLLLSCMFMAVPQAQAVSTNSQTVTIQKNTVYTEDKIVTADFSVQRGKLDLAGNDLTVHGNFYLENGSVTLNRGTLNIQGDLYVSGDLYLSSGTVNVEGNLIQPTGKIDLGSGKLNVEKSYYMANPKANDAGEQVLSSSHGRLVMSNAQDKVTIGGDFYMDNVYGVDISAGTLTVSGDFTQLSDFAPRSFCAEGSSKVVLNGKEPQTVALQSERSTFAQLEIANNTQIVVTNYFAAEKLTASQGAVNLQSENAVFGDVTLGVPKATITGDLTLNGDWDLKGSRVKLDGSLIQTGGELIVNRGTLDISEDYYIAVPQTSQEGEVSWGSSSGMLTMQNASDKVTVGRDFYMDTRGATTCTAGTLTVSGDFTQKHTSGSRKFAADNVHKVILNGTEAQTITMESPESTFAALTVNNNQGIIVTNYLSAASLDAAGDALKVQSQGAAFEHVVLDVSLLSVTGDLTLDGDLNLKTGAMQISGDLIQTNGTLDVYLGTLDIAGDYYMAAPQTNEAGEQGWGTGYGKLVMRNSRATVNVGGNFYMDSIYDNECTAGTMAILGDVTLAEANNEPVFVRRESAPVERISSAETSNAPRYLISNLTGMVGLSNYILNTSTRVFHYTSCHSVKQMNNSNKKPLTGTRSDAIAMGYRPCGNCDP